MRSAAVLAVFLALGACKDRAPAPAPEAPATTSAASDALPGDSPTKKLALAKTQGSSPVDNLLSQLQSAARSNPGKIDNWVLLGRTWIKKARETSDPGFYLNAKACADIALEIEPGSRMATNLEAMVLLNDHKFVEAREVARKILAKSEDDLQALGTVSDAENELGNYDAAVKAIEKMVSMKPNLPSYIRAYYVQWLRGDLKAAQESVRLAIDSGMDRNDPEPRCWAMVQAAMMFWHQGDYPGAEAGSEMTLKSCSEYPPALVGRGRVAMAKGDYARAAESFQRAYTQSPQVETAWLLGDAKKAAGDSQGADAAYAEVVKRGRQSDPRTLALFYATHDRDHEEAVKLATEEKKVRDDIYTEDTVAWALYRAGKLTEAREASDKAIALGTKDARLLYHAGAIRLALGDKSGGRRLVVDALKLNPKFDLTGSAEAEKIAANAGE